MFSIFKKIKQFTMKKEELEQQLAEAIAVAQRLGTENKRLAEENKSLTEANTKISEDFNSAVERTRYLAEQLKMKEAQQTATDRFNDNDRKY